MHDSRGGKNRKAQTTLRFTKIHLSHANPVCTHRKLQLYMHQGFSLRRRRLFFLLMYQTELHSQQLTLYTRKSGLQRAHARFGCGAARESEKLTLRALEYSSDAMISVRKLAAGLSLFRGLFWQITVFRPNASLFVRFYFTLRYGVSRSSGF